MSKVCRIVKSVDLNRVKYLELKEQARLLGTLRKAVWHEFGSLKGVGANHRKIRTEWVKTKDFSPLPAKAWKETLRDALDDISMCEASAKVKARRDINKRVKEVKERKRLFNLLRGNKWVKDPLLSRFMRKHKRHGRTKVNNYIVLESGIYGQFTGMDGNTWLKIPSFTRGEQVCVPLNSSIQLKGGLRVILKDGIVYVHYAINEKIEDRHGDLIVGADKGYTEAFADSEGNFYGKDFGKVLTDYSDKVNQRGKARNRLFKLAEKKPHKAKNIEKFNLGRKKLEKTNRRKKLLVRDLAFKSVHQLVDLAKEICVEDLSRPMDSKDKGKRVNRILSGWAKGSLQEALESVTKRRGSFLRLLNACYSSQMDSKTHRLEGRRVGDKFYHVNGEVSQADTNAAVNLKHRGDDTEITLHMSYKQVKKILLERLTAKEDDLAPVFGE
ncbi:MAG: IS605 OrfB family transposase [bacterium]|jgi:IS605 OrfB family transposase